MSYAVVRMRYNSVILYNIDKFTSAGHLISKSTDGEIQL